MLEILQQISAPICQQQQYANNIPGCLGLLRFLAKPYPGSV
jgi:hypothetical protein